ncbi:MAG: ABC transporter permease [Solirubrobacteraceae bacterium]|nr:ABC transporter permease [Solirubrobacteraceae bacterium]
MRNIDPSTGGAATAPDPAPVPPPEPAAIRRMLSSDGFRASVTFIAFLALFAVYAVWLGDSFMTTDGRLLDVHQNAPVLLLGLAVLVTLIAGQFDLSVASMATLTTFLAIGLKVNQDWPFLLVIVACLGIGVIGGLLNGFLVVRLRVNTFIATLATGGIFLGLSSVYSKGTQLSPTEGDPPIPGWFSGPDSLGAFGNKVPSVVAWIVIALLVLWAFTAVRSRRPERFAEGAWAGIAAGIVAVATAVLLVVGAGGFVEGMSWTILLLLVVGLGLWTLITQMTYGRHLHATGANPEAARLAGVRTERVTVQAFVIGGVLAALAGIVLAANQGSASPDVAAGYLLPAFAAAFLSTVVLSSGRFTVPGTIIGGTFLVWVSQGLIVGGLEFTWNEVVNGVVLAVAVAFSTVFRKDGR